MCYKKVTFWADRKVLVHPKAGMSTPPLFYPGFSVRPSDYRLFQAADMICTLELLVAKAEDGSLSKSEREFFGGMRDLKKNYLKPLAKMASLPGAK